MNSKFSFLGLLLIIGLVYANSIKTPFYYDDFNFILNNPGIAKLGNFRYLWQRQQYYELFGERTYRPVTSGVYLLLKPALGNKPGAWRTFNLLLHLFNCCLFYLLLRRFDLHRNLAALAAAIFAVHTVHTQIFNVISFNEDLIGGCFALAAFYCYFQKGWLAAVASVILFFLSSLSKEIFILLPVLCLLFSWYERSELNAGFYLRQLGLWLTAGVALYVTFSLMKNPHPILVAEYPGGSLFSALMTFAVVLVYYLKLFFLPLGLTPIYNFPVYASISNWPVAGSLILLGCLGSMIIYGFLKRELFAWFFCWFFVFLLPTSNIIPYGAILAERYLYIPFLGLVPAGLLLAKYWLERFKLKWEKQVYGVGLAFIVILSSFTIQRNMVWQNPETLWLDTANKTPAKAARARLNLGDFYNRQKNYGKAIEQYKLVIEASPQEATAYYNLGNVYYKLGQYRLAREYFTKAMQYKDNLGHHDDYYKTLYNLAVTCVKNEDSEAAARYFQMARDIRPQIP